MKKNVLSGRCWINTEIQALEALVLIERDMRIKDPCLYDNLEIKTRRSLLFFFGRFQPKIKRPEKECFPAQYPIIKMKVFLRNFHVYLYNIYYIQVGGI